MVATTPADATWAPVAVDPVPLTTIVEGDLAGVVEPELKPADPEPQPADPEPEPVDPEPEPVNPEATEPAAPGPGSLASKVDLTAVVTPVDKPRDQTSTSELLEESPTKAFATSVTVPGKEHVSGGASKGTEAPVDKPGNRTVYFKVRPGLYATNVDVFPTEALATGVDVPGQGHETPGGDGAGAKTGTGKAPGDEPFGEIVPESNEGEGDGKK